MSAADSETEQLLQLLQDSQSTSYVVVAALTVLVLDHIMTLGEEIEYMWGSKWNLAKTLYLWNRYFGLAALSFDAFYYVHPTAADTPCGIFLQFQGVAATIIVGTVDIVLLLRVYVLYENSKKMLMFLIPLVLCEVVSMESLAVLATPLKQFARFGPLLRGCYTISAVPRFLNFYTIPALITSSIMFVMTLHKCGFAIYNQMTSEMPVIRLFARDGIVWFIAVLLITCTDIIIWTAGRPTLAEVNIVMSCALYSIIASRVLLNIKTTLMEVDNITELRHGATELRFMVASAVTDTIT